MNTRKLAASALERVTREGKSLTAALDGILPTISREDDQAFVQAICFGVARWYHRLDFILGRLAVRPIRDEHVRLLALVGIFQLEFMRVKPHAAVAETVSAAGAKVWAKPLLNGVLRSYQRERERLLRLADRDESAAFSHPQWLVSSIRSNWPKEHGDILHRSNLPAPMTLRVNRRRGNRDDYLALLKTAGIPARPCRFAPSGIILENPVEVGRLPGFATGLVSVQDEAAQLAADLLRLSPGQRILDACAAPGGKTLHVLETEPGLDELTALDIDPERIVRIRENLDREGLAARLVRGDAARPGEWWDGKGFDRILLDAPCSAMGVIRRHPDIKLLRLPADIPKLVELQRKILEGLWPLLSEGGLLVYATCSILKEENEIQVANFIRNHPEAREIPITAEWGSPGVVGRQILTGENDMDGFYYACLAK